MASVLQTIVEKKHYKFVDKVDSWQEAVRLSAESLVADGSVDADYYQQIVNCVEKYGPYVVFAKHFRALGITTDLCAVPSPRGRCAECCFALTSATAR